MPWLSAFAAWAHAALGGDPSTHGIEADRTVLNTVLNTMLRYAMADGLASPTMRIEVLLI